MGTDKQRNFMLKDVLPETYQYDADDELGFLEKRYKNRKLYFGALDEAIIELNAMFLFKSDFKDVALPYDDFISTPLRSELAVQFLALMCEKISAAFPDRYPYGSHSFNLFQQATFGHGNWLPLARIIQKAWGNDGLNKFKHLMIVLDHDYHMEEGTVAPDLEFALETFLEEVK